MRHICICTFHVDTWQQRRRICCRECTLRARSPRPGPSCEAKSSTLIVRFSVLRRLMSRVPYKTHRALNTRRFDSTKSLNTRDRVSVRQGCARRSGHLFKSRQSLNLPERPYLVFRVLPRSSEATLEQGVRRAGGGGGCTTTRGHETTPCSAEKTSIIVT